MEDDNNAAMLEWTEVWRTDNSRRERDAYLSDGLPRFATVRSEIRNCTIDHLINEDVDLALSRHSIRTILTACRSSRCEVEHVDEACMCRYKINTCLGGNTTVVYQQGWHLMLDVGAESPPCPHLTQSMRELLSASLTVNPGASAFQLFAPICHCVEVDDLAGPPPTREQVACYLRTWRRHHPVNGVQHGLELLDTALFDAVGMSPDTPRCALYFSDSRLLGRQAVASIGVGTEFSPFRVGISCYDMLLNYLKVQRNPDMTSMVHIDNTHKIVRQDYPVFVVGYSGKCSHFFPIAYFCTSKRQAFDVASCLGTLKKAAQRAIGETFAPDFVMMDGDVAQFNACSVEIPSSEIIMCWYHVTDNVFKQEVLSHNRRFNSSRICTTFTSRLGSFSRVSKLAYSPSGLYWPLEALPTAWDSIFYRRGLITQGSASNKPFERHRGVRLRTIR